MSIYIFGSVEMQAYRSICTAIQNYNTHAKIPTIDIYKKALSESKQGYMYNQNQIRMSSGFFGCELSFEICDEFNNGRLQTDIRVIPEIAEIMNLARKEKTVYEAIKTVYAYFVENYEYAYSLGNDLKYHSAISVFMYRKSVCEGFALAFANVLNRLGIPCGIVTGQSSLGGTYGAHAWNIVELDRNYYHLDVTWDICTKEKGIDIFDYFFLDDKLVRKDHQWNDVSVPAASDVTKEFYMKNNRCCKNEQECMAVLAAGLRQKKSTISFRFIGNDSGETISVQNIKSLFERTVNRVHCSYRSVSFSVNSMCGTVYFSLTY